MVQQKVVVKNPSGIHMRPANVLVQIANKCTSDITITDGKSAPVSAKSILKLMASQFNQGTEVTVTCTGENEVEDLKTIIDAIESGLGEL